MSAIAPALERLCAAVLELTGLYGRAVDAAALNILTRAGVLVLDPPGLSSPNRACRLVRAADGWMAVNLARREDHDLIPAWMGSEPGPDVWRLLAAHAGDHACAALIEAASLLGLPAGAVGEIVKNEMQAPLIRYAVGLTADRPGPLKVIDLSALWAGPLCGAVLAAMGASVTKVESRRRPDPTRTSTPAFFERLNDLKRDLQLDFEAPSDRIRLRAEILAADILITSARPRAFTGLGLDPTDVFKANPGLVWVAITGYGWTGDAATRVAFGDDAAAAGGLVAWTPQGEPRFLGDALADPVTGLAAVEGALRSVTKGGGLLVDVSLAGSAAGAAALCGRGRPPWL